MTLLKGMILLMDFKGWGISHEKFAVVLNEKDNGLIGLCLINSLPNMLPVKKNFQVRLSKDDYKCFSHDSFVDCGEVKIIKKEDIDKDFDNKKVKVCEHLKTADMENVVKAGKHEHNMALNRTGKSFF